MIALDVMPRANTRNDSPFRFLGCPTTLRATAATTNGAFGLIENLMPPGFASPYHVHKNEDEAFYVLEGEVAFVCGGEWLTGGPGTYVFGPRGVPHGFKVVGRVCGADTAAVRAGWLRAVRARTGRAGAGTWGVAVGAGHGQADGRRGQVRHPNPGPAAGIAPPNGRFPQPSHGRAIIARAPGKMSGDGRRAERGRPRSAHCRRRW